MPPKGQSNNLQGDLPELGKARRDKIETALSVLHGVLVDVDELAVRIEQAIHRTPLVLPVLGPAVRRVAQIREHVSVVHGDLSEYWRTGQVNRWE